VGFARRGPAQLAAASAARIALTFSGAKNRSGGIVAAFTRTNSSLASRFRATAEGVDQIKAVRLAAALEEEWVPVPEGARIDGADAARVPGCRDPT
jgi:hypothetical protein